MTQTTTGAAEARDGHAIEMILTRQLAGYLALPMVLVNPANELVFFNEPAEVMLGRSFDELEPMPWTARARKFEFVDENGNVIPPEELPLTLALDRRQLVHRRLWLQGMDGVRRHMAETAIPLIGNAGQFLGAVAFFSEIEQ